MSYPLLVDKLHRVVSSVRNATFAPQQRPVLFSGPNGVSANHGALWDTVDSYWGGYYYYFDDHQWLMLELVYEASNVRPDVVGERTWLSESGTDRGYLAYVVARIGTDGDGVAHAQWSADRFGSMSDVELVRALQLILAAA